MGREAAANQDDEGSETVSLCCISFCFCYALLPFYMFTVFSFIYHLILAFICLTLFLHSYFLNGSDSVSSALTTDRRSTRLKTTDAKKFLDKPGLSLFVTNQSQGRH